MLETGTWAFTWLEDFRTECLIKRCQEILYQEKILRINIRLASPPSKAPLLLLLTSRLLVFKQEVFH